MRKPVDENRYLTSVTGYLHPRYARSLQEFGNPRELPRSGGWILERHIPNFPYRDAMGCYPLFACQDWSQLHVDLEELGDDLVSIALVTDPFGDYDLPLLRQCFKDVVLPFKEHYTIDLHKSRNSAVSKHHRYYARKALRTVSVEEVPEPAQFIDEWMDLHKHLVDKHNVSGIRAFSKQAFSEQLCTPGMVVMRAMYKGKAIAAMLFFLQGDVVYAHVLGCTAAGYELGALYAVLWVAIDRFGSTARWCDIMGIPGLNEDGAEGIRQFKRGWTKETRTAFLCGRILNPTRYAEIVKASSIMATTYFPAYRDSELG